nr:OCIA domain-containing protein 1 isoform X2 [Dromaius novaehollandiae]
MRHTILDVRVINSIIPITSGFTLSMYTGGHLDFDFVLKELSLKCFCFGSFSVGNFMLFMNHFNTGIFLGLAGTCGYLAGKISYLPICSEKFKKLKDSPIGDVLRQAQRHSSHNRSSRKSEFSDIPSQSFTESSSQRPGSPLSSSYSDDYSSTDRALSSYEPVPFSASLNESSPTGITDYTVQADYLTEN